MHVLTKIEICNYEGKVTSIHIGFYRSCTLSFPRTTILKSYMPAIECNRKIYIPQYLYLPEGCKVGLYFFFCMAFL